MQALDAHWDENGAPELSVCLLAYNEEGCLNTFLDSMVEGLSSTPWRWELIVVDDASQDRTPDIIREWSAKEPRVRTVRHAKNMGYALATRTALQAADGESVVVVDGDGQHDFAQVRIVFDLLRSPGVDIVFPVRISRSEPLQRRIASLILQILCRMFLRFPLRDVNGGIKGMSRSAAQRIQIQEQANLVNPELWARSTSLGLRYEVAEVPQLPRIDDKPSTTFKNPARQLVFICKYVWRLRASLQQP